MVTRTSNRFSQCSFLRLMSTQPKTSIELDALYRFSGCSAALYSVFYSNSVNHITLFPERSCVEAWYTNALEYESPRLLQLLQSFTVLKQRARTTDLSQRLLSQSNHQDAWCSDDPEDEIREKEKYLPYSVSMNGASWLGHSLTGRTILFPPGNTNDIQLDQEC